MLENHCLSMFEDGKGPGVNCMFTVARLRSVHIGMSVNTTVFLSATLRDSSKPYNPQMRDQRPRVPYVVFHANRSH